VVTKVRQYIFVIAKNNVSTFAHLKGMLKCNYRCTVTLSWIIFVWVCSPKSSFTKVF